MCDDHLTSELFSIAPWRTVEIFHNLSLRAKEELPLSPQNVKIAQHTAVYEDYIRKLWQEAKSHPTRENIIQFIEAMVVASDTIWEKYYLDLLDLEDLLPHHRAQLDKDLNQHRWYLQNSLLPDLLKEVGKDQDAFNKYDYRVIFLYAGALWSAGMLATVLFDGAEMRDLADVFLFAGPNDENTCTGKRGCKQYANNLYTVAQILAEDIVPGHLRCLYSCRHLLIPVASPLKAKTKGGAGSGFHGHSGRPGQVGGSSGKGVISINLEEFAADWYHKKYNESDLAVLRKLYPYNGTAFRALVIGMPDPYEDTSDAAANLLSIHHSKPMSDYVYNGLVPAEEFQKMYESAYLEWAKTQIKLDTSSTKYSSWAKSLSGIEYYSQRMNYDMTASGQIIKSAPDVIMKANVRGIDLEKAVKDVNTFHATVIKGAEEVIADSAGSIDLIAVIQWG